MARTPVRLWIAAGLAVCVLLAFAGWTFAIDPQRARAADDRATIEATMVQNTALRSRSAVLAGQMGDIGARRAELAVKEQSLPGTNDLDRLVVALNAAAATAGVVIEEVIAGVPIDLSPPPEVVSVDPALQESETPEGDGAATDPTAADAVEPAARSTLFALPVTLRVSGSAAAIQTFLDLMRDQPRAVLFVSLSFAPLPSGLTLAEGAMLTAETRVFTSRDAITAEPTPVP